MEMAPCDFFRVSNDGYHAVERREALRGERKQPWVQIMMRQKERACARAAWNHKRQCGCDIAIPQCTQQNEEEASGFIALHHARSRGGWRHAGLESTFNLVQHRLQK